MFDGDVHAFNIAQNRAALFLQGCGEVPYFGGRGVKELVKLFAESCVVGRNRGQHPRKEKDESSDCLSSRTRVMISDSSSEFRS